MEKRSVYIAIELKVREFVSQIFLAHELIKNNYRVYIGSKEEIVNLVSSKKKKAGIFLYKAGLHKNLMKNVEKKINVHSVLDQEACPGFPIKMYKNELIPGAFHKETEETLDLYFTANNKIEKIAKKRLKFIKGKVSNSGWPRIDLWSDKYKYIYLKEIMSLKKKYGSFIIFISDFGFVDDNHYTQAATIPWGGSNELKKKYFEEKPKIAKRAYKEFQLTSIFIKKIAKKYNSQKFIIRAHPSENIQAWKKIYANQKNIIVTEPVDDVAPYIYASRGVLHRGCTTSLQAMCSNKPVGYLSTQDSEKINEISSKLSYKIKTLADFKVWLKFKNKKSLTKNKKLIQELNLDRDLAVKNITNEFNNYKCEKEEPISYPKDNKFKLKYLYYVNYIKRNILIFLIKLKFSKKNIDNFGRAPKIYGGIKLHEVKKYINRFNFKKKQKITLKQISQNIVSIEKK